MNAVAAPPEEPRARDVELVVDDAPRTLLGTLAHAGSWIASRLPERPLVAAAIAGGELWYRLTPDRAARARRNLRRVVTALAAQPDASEVVRRAATDDAALERLVRRAYRHAARYYLELARPPAVDAEGIERRLSITGAPGVVESLRTAPRTMLVGIHLGAIEMPITWVGLVSGREVTAPMEELGDPGLQAWFVRSRGAAGVRLITIQAARRDLLAVLRRGGIAGIVGDRDLTGGGIATTLFGHPTKLPAGPAMLALEGDAQLIIGAVWRVAGGRYQGRLLRLDVPTEGTRRQRVQAIVDAEARAIEWLVAKAPEQWWAAFQPIWPDLEAEAT